MHDTQPPITNDGEYETYKQALQTMNGACAEREQRLFEVRDDPEKLEGARSSLFHIYRRRQGIIDAIEAYERQKAS
jgi:hypothetical protein